MLGPSDPPIAGAPSIKELIKARTRVWYATPDVSV